MAKIRDGSFGLPGTSNDPKPSTVTSAPAGVAEIRYSPTGMVTLVRSARA
jgi:hypothetical protein